MSLSIFIVRVAAATLPHALRDRYREQWLADVRDAPEQNLRPAQIALGSVAFAATVGRPWPKRAVLGADGVERRARIARGLALSAALLGISGPANEGNTNGPSMGAMLDTTYGIANSALATYAVLAVVLALALIVSTRSFTARTRWAVVLFSGAAAVPVAQLALANSLTDWGSYADIASFAPWLFVGAGVLILAGLALNLLPVASTRVARRPLALAGLVVILAGVPTVGDALLRYVYRPPLRFGLGARNSSNPQYVEWLRLKEHAENQATMLFFWCAIFLVGIAAVVVIVAVVRRLDRRALLFLTAVAVGVVFIGAGGVFGYFTEFYGPVTFVEGPVLLVLGRVIFIASVLLYARGGRSVATDGVTTPPASQLLPPRSAVSPATSRER